MSFDSKKYFKEYAKTHASKMREYRKAWILRNPEKVRKYWRKKSARYQSRNRPKVLESKKDYYRRNRCRLLDYAKQRHITHKEIDNDRVKNWRKSNPHKTSQYSLKRRSLMAKASVNLTTLREFVFRIRNNRNCRCYYCDSEVDGKFAHFDHIIPLSKGGSHSVENLCVSCAPCNRSKHATLLENWDKHPQIFLNL